MEGSESILYNSVTVDTCHYTFVKTHRMNNTLGNPKLWTLVNNNNNASVVTSVQYKVLIIGDLGWARRRLWTFYVSSLQFFHKPKTALKIKS